MGTEVNSSATPVAPEFLRVETEEDFITLKFGKLENEQLENEKQFVVLSEIKIKPGALYSMLVELYRVGIKYEKTYNRSIGFSENL